MTLVNKNFAPRGKMSVSDLFLDAEFISFQNFSITQTFRVAFDEGEAKAYIFGFVGGGGL